MTINPNPGAATPDTRPIGVLTAITRDHRQGDTLGSLLDLLAHAGSGLGICGVTAHVLRRNSLVQVGFSGLPDDEIEIGRLLPIIAPLPATDCVRLGIPVWLGSRDQITRNYPTLQAAGAGRTIQALAAVPIDRQARTVGVLTVAFDRDVTFADDIDVILTTVARFCAPMLEFDHHEPKGAPQTASSSIPVDDDAATRISDLEARITRLEQLLEFVAGTVGQHLNS